MNDEINKFVDLFKELEQLGFSEITYYQYSEDNGGEICVNYNGMGFSIQLWEDDGRIVIDLALTEVTTNGITFNQNTLHFKHDHFSYLDEYGSIKEAVECTILEILTCDAAESYDRVFAIVKSVKKRLSEKSQNAFEYIVKNYF